MFDVRAPLHSPLDYSNTTVTPGSHTHTRRWPSRSAQGRSSRGSDESFDRLHSHRRGEGESLLKTGQAAERQHWDATQGGFEIVRNHQPHRETLAYIPWNLWKMKIFSRFHYVWYLVSVQRLSYSMCVFMHATVCPWLFIVIVCVYVCASLAWVVYLVCMPFFLIR